MSDKKAIEFVCANCGEYTLYSEEEFILKFVYDLKVIRGFEYIYDDQTLVDGINEIIKKWEERLK